ncbi:MAG: TauD/TfdA family dioxygenase [Legionella sp.]|nr:TauD/TfdA family dioxygenase [Legionella sp.]
MNDRYPGMRVRFLRQEERLIQSDEHEMPLVFEAQEHRDVPWLQNFLTHHSKQIIQDLAQYGALLFRGFAVKNEADFEHSLLSIPEFRGIHEAFMSENGRDQVPGNQYVLYTNSVYKTGGTLYLGGFHTENYYSADVPSYISFCCLEPSALGGETGIINTAKIYAELNPALQQRLQQESFFVSEWRVDEVAKRYGHEPKHIETICEHFDLPLLGKERNRLVRMYKPSVMHHPLTQENALTINLFELTTLNDALRKIFMHDYQGADWFWHRFLWRMPPQVFNALEQGAKWGIPLYHSPVKAWHMALNKWSEKRASKKNGLNTTPKVGTCFNEEEVQELARSMRRHYCSCLWQKGDILLVDNRKVMHAGMPGKGARAIRAMIGNPLEMRYSAQNPGYISGNERKTASIGACMAAGQVH